MTKMSDEVKVCVGASWRTLTSDTARLRGLGKDTDYQWLLNDDDVDSSRSYTSSKFTFISKCLFFSLFRVLLVSSHRSHGSVTSALSLPALHTSHVSTICLTTCTLLTSVTPVVPCHSCQSSSTAIVSWALSVLLFHVFHGSITCPQVIFIYLPYYACFVSSNTPFLSPMKDESFI